MTDTTPIRVALSGVTGWAGAALARGIVAAPDLHLVAGIARRAAGRSVGEALGVDCAAPVVATAAEAVAHRPDVFFEFSKPDVALDNVLAAIGAGAHVVVGTSGLSNEDYARVDAAARAAGRGVLACGNFAITAVLLQKFAEMAVKWLPDVELIDYAYEGKVDVPSGTVRELSVRLARRAATRSPRRCRPRRCAGRSRRAAPRCPASRCIRCACPATCSAPRRSSARPTSGCTCATRRARARRSTCRARCSRSAACRG